MSKDAFSRVVGSLNGRSERLLAMGNAGGGSAGSAAGVAVEASTCFDTTGAFVAGLGFAGAENNR
jgi:hypothetical protein